MRVALAADHAGFPLKEHLKRLLDDLRIPYDDLGPPAPDPVDYPDFAEAVATAVRDGRADRGILVCATGVGMAIAANKIPGVRAALVSDPAVAALSREHNDANVLALGGRTVEPDTAREITRVFLTTPFSGGRHARRVNKIIRLESSPARTGTSQP